MTSINSVRLTSAQILMRTLKEEATGQSQSTTSGSLADALSANLGSDDDSDSDDYTSKIYSLLETYGAAGTTTDESAESAEISSDIGTASFMAGLKQTLEDMTKNAETKDRAEAMLKALAAGTLTVTDASTGQTIKAWDVDAASEKNTTSKPTAAIVPQDWSDFLKNRLTRDRNATYKLGADGAYIDKVTGENSAFRTVGDNYVYLSWPDVTASV